MAEETSDGGRGVPGPHQKVQAEHRQVAESVTGWFTAAEFKAAYLRQFPDRAEGSIIPSDHVVGHFPVGKEGHAKFLEWDKERGVYRFVGAVTSGPRQWHPKAWRAEFERRHGAGLAAIFDRVRDDFLAAGFVFLGSRNRGDETASVWPVPDPSGSDETPGPIPPAFFRLDGMLELPFQWLAVEGFSPDDEAELVDRLGPAAASIVDRTVRRPVLPMEVLAEAKARQPLLDAYRWGWGKLYGVDKLPVAPVDAVQIAAAAEAQAAAERRVGQGFVSSAACRRAVELHAMDRAKAFYRDSMVEDTSATESYDLVATKGGERLYIEVKGTTTRGDTVFLTKNEVAHARAHQGQCVLFVVANIEVTGDDDVGWTTSGGDDHVIVGWEPAPEDLVALAYQYTVPGCED